MSFLPQKPSATRCALAVGALLCGANAFAADATADEIDTLRRSLETIEQKASKIKRTIAEQETRLRALKSTQSLDQLDTTRGRGPEPATEPATKLAVSSGQARAPAVAPIFESPGVLTPKDQTILEPSFNFSYASSNRVALVGYTIIPALLIGLIDVREVKRNTFTAAITARRGLTNRFEIEAKVPYVYRSDSAISRRIASPDRITEGLFDASGEGLGDVEFTGRYQLNDGGTDQPFYIASLRFKSRTGKDPFEVTTASAIPGGLTNQLQRTLPTGSGFYTWQPAITVLYPTDPGVFFGGVSYQHNIERKGLSLRTDEGDQPVGDIQPGGVIGFNFGLGLALNERSSMSIGYDHSSIARTKQNGEKVPESVRTQLGALLLGYSHKVSPKTTVNVSVGVGVTRDSPDVSLTLRVPIGF